jgi:carboxypeptidase family protein
MSARTLAVLLAISIATQSAIAQSTFGSIVGGVKDPAELVVAGAQITLTNLDDKSARTAVADANGSFEFLNVKSGRYEIVVLAAGFATFKMSSVQLEARQTLRVSIPLKIATAAETIEVGDTAPPINTENATLGDNKDFLQISELPVNYRGATTSPLAALRCRAHSKIPTATSLSEEESLRKFNTQWMDPPL